MTSSANDDAENRQDRAQSRHCGQRLPQREMGDGSGDDRDEVIRLYQKGVWAILVQHAPPQALDFRDQNMI